MPPVPFREGDILELSSLFGYLHHAIFVSGTHENGRYQVVIIHVAGTNPCERPIPQGAEVREEEVEFTSMFPSSMIANNYDNHWVTYNPDEILKRARSKLGEWPFDAQENNDEHFANWCRYGQRVSSQSLSSGESDGVKCIGLAPGVAVGPVRARFANGRMGISKGDEKGVVLETSLAEAEAGPVTAKLGLGITTGIRTGNDTIGAQVLGTGFTVGRETSVSVFGTKLGFKLW